MEFIAIIGDPGSGKTNMLVKYLYAEYRQGTPIVSNLKTLKFPQRYMGFDEFIKTAEIDGDDFMDCFVATDELGLGADSYDFLSAKNRGLSSFNAQRRKLHLRWAYTVQRFNWITKRLRQLTDAFISMHDPDKNNLYYPDGRRARFHREVCQGIFVADYFDRNMKFLHRRRFNGRKYWPLYDTDERIATAGKGKLLVPDLGEDEDY